MPLVSSSVSNEINPASTCRPMPGACVCMYTYMSPVSPTHGCGCHPTTVHPSTHRQPNTASLLPIMFRLHTDHAPYACACTRVCTPRKHILTPCTCTLHTHSVHAHHACHATMHAAHATHTCAHTCMHALTYASAVVVTEHDENDATDSAEAVMVPGVCRTQCWNVKLQRLGGLALLS